jgi:hypothetical protein
MAKQVLNVPPFPQLEWDRYCWVSEVGLAGWMGFDSFPRFFAGMPASTIRVVFDPGHVV